MPVVKLSSAHTAIFLCDMQTRFRTAIYGFEEVVSTVNKILKITTALDVPVLVTEQNSKSLGNTVPEIALGELGPLHIGTIEKTLFSMVTPEVKSIISCHENVRSIIIAGIETHICVLQTALDLIELGYDVHILADGVSSSNKQEIPIALNRISQAGGYITTSESVAFQLLQDAGNANFRQIAGIIKDEKDKTRQALEVLCTPLSNV